MNTLNLSATITISRKCSCQNGLTGNVANYCRVCGASHRFDVTPANGDVQPCGNSWGSLCEYDETCIKCNEEGNNRTGMITEQVSLADVFTTFQSVHADLLEVAELLVQDYDRAPHVTGWYTDTVEKARKALAKVKGETE